MTCRCASTSAWVGKRAHDLGNVPCGDARQRRVVLLQPERLAVARMRTSGGRALHVACGHPSGLACLQLREIWLPRAVSSCSLSHNYARPTAGCSQAVG